MRLYRLPNANEWFYYCEVEGDPNDHNLNLLPQIADSIFPGITSEPLIIVNTRATTAPICFSDNRVIFVNVEHVESYAQLIYQLGHELCHVYINSDQETALSRSMFWFEEVLCEVSSHLFLSKFNPTWNIQTQSQRYDSYSKEHLSGEYIEPFKTKGLFIHGGDLINYLKSNSQDRLKNSYLASLLLPYFLENPTMTFEFNLLSHSYSIEHFDSFLENWRKLSSSIINKEVISEIIELLESH